MFDRTRQNGYQKVPFSVYIHNLMFVSIIVLLLFHANTVASIVSPLFLTLHTVSHSQQIYWHQ